MTSTLVLDYRTERAAQDERFNARRGAGAVDASLTETEEYRAYFGLGEFAGAGVEVRVTFKSFLVARAAERRAAERYIAEVEAPALTAAEAAALPIDFLLVYVDARVEVAIAELDRRAGEQLAEVVEVEAEIVAEVAEVAEVVEPAVVEAEIVTPAAEVVEAPIVVEAVKILQAAALARVATPCVDCSYTDREDLTMTNDAHEFTAAGTDYTVTDGGTITLGRSTFRVEITDYAETGGRMVWLYGARGAVYFLRGFLGADDGTRQVISWKSGAPLRQRGNEVRVVMLGDVIEVAA